MYSFQRWEGQGAISRLKKALGRLLRSSPSIGRKALWLEDGKYETEQQGREPATRMEHEGLAKRQIGGQVKIGCGCSRENRYSGKLKQQHSEHRRRRNKLHDHPIVAKETPRTYECLQYTNRQGSDRKRHYGQAAYRIGSKINRSSIHQADEGKKEKARHRAYQAH